MANNTDGRWITVNGTHIFIKNGQSVGDAFKATTGKSIDGKAYGSKYYKNPSADEVKSVVDEAGWNGGYTGDARPKFLAHEHLENIAYSDMGEDGLSFSKAYSNFKKSHKEILKMYKDDGDKEAYKNEQQAYKIVTSVLDKHFKKTTQTKSAPKLSATTKRVKQKKTLIKRPCI